MMRDRVTKTINRAKYVVKHRGISAFFFVPYKKAVKRLNRILVFVFRFFPINNNKIILESQGDYSDNVRAFYEYLLSIDQLPYKIIWFVQEPGYFKKKYNGLFISRNENRLNIIADYHIATAKCFVFSHPYWLKSWRKNQIVINTTHSVAQLKASPNNGQNKLYDYVLTCSDYCTEIRKKTFFDDCSDHFICIGQPRLDLMYHHKDCKALICPNNRDKSMVLCMETFKQTVSWDDGGNKDKYALNVISCNEELKQLDSFLALNNYIMIIKIHHLQDLSAIRTNSLSNIIYLSDKELEKNDIQINELLENADVLLTDYSSVFYDYLIMDRPIGFLIGDIQEYKRGFMMSDPIKEMPGKVINSLAELTTFLKTCQDGNDEYADQRKQLRDLVFRYNDDRNSKRLLDWIINNC